MNDVTYRTVPFAVPNVASRRLCGSCQECPGPFEKPPRMPSADRAYQAAQAPYADRAYQAAKDRGPNLQRDGVNEECNRFHL
jgi:hypothetical protein